MNGSESSKTLIGTDPARVSPDGGAATSLDLLRLDAAVGRPLVSVVIPAFNAQDTIAATLASVLKQTWTSFEVVVVDDGSVDRTAEIVEAIAANDSRVRIYRQKNQGPAEARNRAIRESAGEWIAPLDADDLWTPDTLDREVQQAQAAPANVAVIYSWSTMVDKDNQPLGGVSMASVRGRVFTTLLCHNFLGNGSCTLVRRAALASVGGYRQEFSPVEDWDLYLRLAERYEFVPVKEFLIGYRQSDRSLSSNCELVAEAQTRMLEDIQRCNPGVPSWLCRLSQSNLYIYFARRDRQRNAAGRQWLWRAVHAHWFAAARLDWWWLLAFEGRRAGDKPKAGSASPGFLTRASLLTASTLLHKTLRLLACLNLLRTGPVSSNPR